MSKFDDNAQLKGNEMPVAQVSVPGAGGTDDSEDPVSMNLQSAVTSLTQDVDPLVAQSVAVERERLELLRSTLIDKTLEFDRASELLSKSRRKAEALQRREQALRSRLEALAAERDGVDQSRQELGSWIGHRQRSYGWRLTIALRNERVTLEGDVDGLWRRLNAPLSVQSAVLSSMRISFSRRVLSWLIIVVAVVLAVMYLDNRYPDLGTWQHWLNVFSWPIWVVLLVGLGLYLLTFLFSLLAYHRKWSGFWSILRSERARTSIYRDAVIQLRQEHQRLKGMHEQVPTYLRLMSEVIHRPWTMTAANGQADAAGGWVDSRVDAAISSTWGVFPRPDTSRIPSLMRLAETPHDGGGAASNELIRRSIVRILRRGWRNDAYEQLLREAETIRGLPAGSFTPERLDREPRVRESFLRALDDGQAQVAAGITHLRELYPRIKTDLMDQVHPRVQRLDPDALEGLDLSVDLLEGVGEEDTGWDELLGSILGTPAGWSPISFTLAGNSGNPEVLARGYGPVRFAGEGVDQTIAYTSQRALVASSLEMTVRIDTLPERVSPSHLQAFTLPMQEGTAPAEPEPDPEVDDTRY